MTMENQDITDLYHMEEDDITQLSQLSQLSQSQISDLTVTPTMSSIMQLHQSSTDSTPSIWAVRVSHRRSWIWRHGNEVIDNGKRYWRCNLCKTNPKQYADRSTKHPIEHLKSHRMTENGPLEIPDNNIIRQAFGSTVPKIQFNLDIFKQLLIQWIVKCNISFRQVEDPEFFILDSSEFLICCHTSLPSPIWYYSNRMASFDNEQKSILIQGFQDINTVHFTFDLWSSPNHFSLLGMTAHWINHEGQACHALLGL